MPASRIGLGLMSQYASMPSTRTHHLIERSTTCLTITMKRHDSSLIQPELNPPESNSTNSVLLFKQIQAPLPKHL